jgi:Protein of unknown function (DUF2786)
MARAAASRQPPDGSSSLEERAELLHGLMSELCLAAVTFVAQAKLEDTARHWLADSRVKDDEERGPVAVGEALALALDVALFSPSASGTTAVDRFARQHRPVDAAERGALATLQRATFRILQVEASDPDGGHGLVDLATGSRFRLFDPSFPSGCEGLAVAARIATVDGDAVVTVGPVTPLDEAALAVARARMRPNGRGLTNPNRCAEAIYRHVVRFGVPAIAGLNRPPEGELRNFLFSPEDGPLHALAFAWSEANASFEPPAADLRSIRELVTEQDLIEALTGCVAARQIRAAGLADAYERVLTIQVETIERRAATGVAGGLLSLDAIADRIRRAVHDRVTPPEIETVFDEVRRRVRLNGLGRATRPADADLDKVLARIQALRAKTVDRGCTEQEAIAAAGKVAELLDRYGLSLSEVDLKEQSCEGFGVGTGRRRFGPIDSCIPAVGEFCDCRVWSEKTADGEIRYVFFGLPADVAGARYLYELVEQAFATETELFKRSELYTQHHSGDRRSATQSFQTGLAHGITRKLDELRRQREETMRAASGRDLVPVKEAVVEEELAKLGLRFHTRGGSKGRYVLRDAYEAGHEAGDRFEYRPGIGEQARGEVGG